MLSKSYYNAEFAFEDLYDKIMSLGEERNGTKTLHNVLIELQSPGDNSIKTAWRKWNKSYAQYEFEWYRKYFGIRCNNKGQIHFLKHQSHLSCKTH